MTSPLDEGARAFGITLTPAQTDAFDTYYRELVAWNTRVNLTTITARDDVIVKHFLDSLSVAAVIASEAKQSPIRDLDAPRAASSRKTLLAMTPRVIDIGAGAGFPGIPLKIALPHLRLILLEATGKKVAFLKHIITQLDLRDAVAIQARAEDLARDAAHRAQYDVAVARAVANLATLVEYALPFVRQGGVFIAQKGVEVDDEIRAAARALALLGGRVRAIAPVRLPGLEPRHLVVIEKVAATPERYPRRAGVPERQPLTN
ncbi:MAG: 16S rRNA (guanine(527)-N(7))-methyltransferase RsmG [Chloroflexi bacterium]|nr:16S rRNA (guanine(527)-N(7))-methyltransferase RsmG [Chloroflexota bacterium]